MKSTTSKISKIKISDKDIYPGFEKDNPELMDYIKKIFELQDWDIKIVVDCTTQDPENYGTAQVLPAYKKALITLYYRLFENQSEYGFEETIKMTLFHELAETSLREKYIILNPKIREREDVVEFIDTVADQWARMVCKLTE